VAPGDFDGMSLLDPLKNCRRGVPQFPNIGGLHGDAIM
jgi:hypothetical protein